MCFALAAQSSKPSPKFNEYKHKTGQSSHSSRTRKSHDQTSYLITPQLKHMFIIFSHLSVYAIAPLRYVQMDIGNPLGLPLSCSLSFSHERSIKGGPPCTSLLTSSYAWPPSLFLPYPAVPTPTRHPPGTGTCMYSLPMLPHGAHSPMTMCTWMAAAGQPTTHTHVWTGSPNQPSTGSTTPSVYLTLQHIPLRVTLSHLMTFYLELNTSCSLHHRCWITNGVCSMQMSGTCCAATAPLERGSCFRPCPHPGMQPLLLPAPHASRR